MTARAPRVDEDAELRRLAAAGDAMAATILAAPIAAPLTPEQEAEVSAVERDIAAGKRGVPHSEIERQIAARRSSADSAE